MARLANTATSRSLVSTRQDTRFPTTSVSPSRTSLRYAANTNAFDKAQAMLALFDRAINYYDIASGTKKVTDTLGSGSDEPKSATHTEAPGTTPSVSGSATPTKYVQSLLSSYSHRDNEAPPTSGPIPTASSS